MLKALTERFELALRTGNLSEILAIITELNALAPSDKVLFLSLYKNIGEELFIQSIEAANYDSSSFEQSIADAGKPAKQKTKNEKKEQVVEDDFAEVLFDFRSKVAGNCIYLKAHFFFLLDNNSNSKTDKVIITDETNTNNPLLQRIHELFPDCPIQRFTLESFLDKCKKESELTDNKYICLLALLPNILHSSKTQDDLKELFSLFRGSKAIKFLNLENFSPKDYNLVNIDESTYENIENICGKTFNNRDITFEEEVMIKKMFVGNSPIIDYKILKKGFSGSKVIEARPIKSMSSKTGRFVIKYAKKDTDKKIYKESKAFKEFIDDFIIESYKGDYDSTDHYEAIKYMYASSDGRSDSHPFASLMEEFAKGKPVIYDLETVIQQLFNCQPFQVWNSVTQIFGTPEKLYTPYLNRDTLLKSICDIQGITIEKAEKTQLWENFQRILNSSFKANTKVCHGDLHSENFFKDDSGVFLIDFGYTAYRHALIDHTTLEASIRFKHIPFYIPVEELLEIERKLFDLSSFNPESEYNFISRYMLKSIFKLIILIRQDARRYLVDDNNPIEYWISLFLISLRQIQYPDLNQRYALEYAFEVSKKIIELNP
jgi:hypothetical protein